MEPIVPIIEPIQAKTQTLPARGTLADLTACIIAALAGLVAFGYAVFFFLNFLENDTYIWGLVSAFLFCFGIGAFGYIPAAIISFIGWTAYKQGASPRPLKGALLLTIPWLILTLVLTFVSDMPKIYSLTAMITVLILSAWALVSLKGMTSS